MVIIQSQAISHEVEESIDLYWAINSLKNHLLKYELEDLFEKIKSVKDIYLYRHILKQIKSQEKFIILTADLILIAIHNKQRFRKFECLKILQNLVKKFPQENNLLEETVDKLFEIYKYFILSEKESIQWCVSSIIKGKELRDDAIDWLISNQLSSKHIVNRLLLYPKTHPKIKNWATEALSNDIFPERRSDLIALLIEDDQPKFLETENSSTIQWAIFKSRIPYEAKINLLNIHSDFNSFQETMKIADRLDSPQILHNLLKKLESMKS